MISLLVLRQHLQNVPTMPGSVGLPAAPGEPAPAPPAPEPAPTEGQLSKAQLVDYVRSRAASRGLDAAAVMAVAEQEGLGGGIGDGGLAYGPWQDHLTEFAGRPWYGHGRNNAQVQAWAWSTEGVDYVLGQMVAVGASGLTGAAAISVIVHGYERSADQAGEIARAVSNYPKWAATV